MKRMRLAKPVYDGSKKVYVCDVKEAEDFIYVTDVYGNTSSFSKSPNAFFDETLPSCVATVLTQTLGWFSKPLVEEWLIQKLSYSIPTETLEKGFDGVVTYTPVRLHISKDKFVLEFQLTDMKESDKVCIDFQEDLPLPSEAAALPTKADAEQVRLERKQKVLQARERAARALFKAEELMHSYVEEYGVDTDWEDEDGEL